MAKKQHVPADAPAKIPTSKKKSLTVAAQQRAEKKQEFLDKFKDYGTLYHTGMAIGVPHSTIIYWLNQDAAFAEAFKSIRAIPGYMIERSSIERAKDPKNQADTLRIFMLKNLLPESYGEADKIQLEVTIKEVLVSNFVSIINQTVPSHCPACKTDLHLTEKIASEMLAMSDRMMKTTGGTIATDAGRT